ncbi:hypothetical protein PHYPSEUDO_007017 [Phytophthora pseudosyringae]|uniref:Uncharacterized protein n=1 Tax=Phytophthora pseudosyringae TaxID=221518 RepID=A0A8T1VH04_9STRA|nr:hypothetical protein PHYPSEUDO_007017 [Phytophthora pseudosyringae]
MSFVLLEYEEEDARATVQEALAMIDASDEVPMLSAIPNEKHSLSDCGGVKRSRQEQNRERDFRRRQRQKEERLQLQMQAQQLELHLSQLRGSGRISHVSVRTRESSCVTPEMLKQRVEAELLNQSLKKALTAEKKWSKSLQSVLDKRQSLETVSLASSMLLSSTQSKPLSVGRSRVAALRGDPAAVRREIMALMDKMYHEAKATVDPVTGAAASIPALACHFNVRLDPKEGPTTQLTSETPLDCGLDSARELLSAMFSMPDPSQPSLRVRRTRAKRTYTEGEVEKEFTVDLGGSRANECLDGIGLLRRHKEDDCELVIWAAISFHHSGKISFSECSWMAAARSAPSASQEAVIRANYRLSAEKAKGCTYIDGEHIDQVRNHALGAIGAKMKAKYHVLQRKMLVETGREDLASFIT